VRFMIRSRVFTEEEFGELEDLGELEGMGEGL